MNRKALGKGLEALIPERPAEQVKTEEKPERGLVQLDVGKIKSNPYQPRTAVDKDKLSELSASIKEKGIIQPIVVRQVGDEFELVAGGRRLLAAKKLGLKIVSAVMAGKLSKEEMMELSLIENLQREDLNPIDVANGYTEYFVECVKRVRDKFPGLTIMAGNVATPEMVQELLASPPLNLHPFTVLAELLASLHT